MSSAPHRKPSWNLWPIKTGSGSGTSGSVSSSTSRSKSITGEDARQSPSGAQPTLLSPQLLPDRAPALHRSGSQSDRSPSSPPLSPAGYAAASATTDDSPPCTPPDARPVRNPSIVHVRGASADGLIGAGGGGGGGAPPGADLPSSPMASKSRNDIFSLSSQPSILLPAPKVRPDRSRNDIFFSTSASSVIAPRSDSIPNSASSSGPSAEQRLGEGAVTRPASTISSSSTPLDSSWSSRSASKQRPGTAGSVSLQVNDERPSYGRSNTEERERERARMRQANDIDFRLCPTKDFLLGEGRHSEVYLGAYKTKRKAGTSPALGGDDAASRVFDGDELSPSTWKLCAIKRLHADRQSQLLGLDEAFALRRLGPHPNVIQLIGLHDEVELSSPGLSSDRDPAWSGSAQPASTDAPSRNGLGKGLPTTLKPEASHHARSTSESQAHADHGLTEAKLEVHTAATSAHRRLASQPLDALAGSSSHAPPEVRIAAPEEDNERAVNAALSPRRPQLSPAASSGASSSGDPPRLLLLLSLHPYSLSTFARKNPDRVDWEQWLTWALELARTIEWMHGRGCVHADLKKENVLLTEDLHVKLCDFNSAVFPHPSAPMMDGFGLGTPAYGAPELTRGAPNGRGFSYGVDVWSLGAVLYSLATGVEPFSRARSMIDIMHRKRIFFESEENDRIARQSVAEGWESLSNGGSASASRNGSLRGRRTAGRPSTVGGADSASTTPSRPTAQLRREGSTDSIESVASIASIALSGRNPSMQAIRMLLDPAPMVGVLYPPSSNASGSTPGSPVGDGNGVAMLHSHHHRAASLGKAHAAARAASKAEASRVSGANFGRTMAQSARMIPVTTAAMGQRTPSQLGISLSHPSRPSVLRRTTSYGGAQGSEDGGAGAKTPNGGVDGLRTMRAPEAPGLPNPPLSPSPLPAASQFPSSPRASNASAGLRLAVAAAFAQNSRQQMPRAAAVAASSSAAPDASAPLSPHKTNNASSSSSHAAHFGTSPSSSRRGASASEGSSSGFQAGAGLSSSDEDEGGDASSSNADGGVQEELRPYADGSPALVLPGGGRLPDAARALLERMLSTDPELRPTASQIVAALEAL